VMWRWKGKERKGKEGSAEDYLYFRSSLERFLITMMNDLAVNAYIVYLLSARQMLAVC